MALVIYQVGDLPVFFDLAGINDDSVALKADRSWVLTKDSFTHVSGDHYYNDPARPLVDSQKLDISGTFICDSVFSAEKSFNHLTSLGGIINIPIIAFRYEECDHVPVGTCCTICNPEIDWILVHGVITKVTQKSEYNKSSEPWSFVLMPVDITLEVGTKWVALNPYRWEYRARDFIINPLSPNIRPSSSSNLFLLPKTFTGLSQLGYFFDWGLPLSVYDASYWGARYADGRRGGLGSDFGPSGDHTFYSDIERWGAAPSSLYSFTNFSDTNGELLIRVQRNYGLFAQTLLEETSSLDLAELNADMIAAGYGGLQGTDIIVTGFVSPFPGLILRDNAPFEAIRPKWDYPGRYPGETGRAYNTVRLYSEGVNAQFAYLHDFGAY